MKSRPAWAWAGGRCLPWVVDEEIVLALLRGLGYLHRERRTLSLQLVGLHAPTPFGVALVVVVSTL
eukprot:COSAG01_NODE_23256_length_822_cov_0.769018_2_plen_65_part_01